MVLVGTQHYPIKLQGASDQPMLKDIAKKVGVSVMTVSIVLRPRGKGQRIRYSIETQQRVLEAAREIGYVPNRSARAMRTRQTGVVAFVAMNFAHEKVQNYTVYPFLVGLNHGIAKTGRRVILVELNELEIESGSQLPEALRERYFDAVIIHFGLSPKALALLEEFTIPIIYWDFGVTNENGVMRDEFEAGRSVTNRLLSLGHQNIAYAPGSEETWRDYRKGRPPHHSYHARYRGYEEAMKARRLRPRVMPGFNAEEHARQIVSTKITALITQGSSLIAHRAASTLRRRIPDDLSVLSVDVEVSVGHAADEVGGASYNRYEAGRIAAQMLQERMTRDGKSVPNVVLPCPVYDGGLIAKPRSV